MRAARVLSSLLIAISLGVGGSSRAEPGVPAPLVSVGVDGERGAPLPLQAEFRASDGREVTLGAALGDGRPALLVLAYNRCEMLCSLVLRSLADLVRDLDARYERPYSVVTLSIDPRDTVHEAARMQAVMLERAGLARQPERWSFLVGERAQIDSVASALGFHYAWDAATQQYAHAAAIFVISADGKLLEYFQGLDPDPGGVARALDGAAASESAAAVLLNCFRFDTASTRYGAIIDAALATGGAAVVLSLLALIGWLLHRERRRAQGRAG